MKRILEVIVVAVIFLCATPRAAESFEGEGVGYPDYWRTPLNCGIYSEDARVRRLLADLAALSTNVYLSVVDERSCRSHPTGDNCAEFIPVEGWAMIGGSGESSRTGLVYRIYRRNLGPGGRSITVFSFRGTQFWSRDWMSNLYLRTAVPPPQHREAEAHLINWLTQHRPDWDLETGAGIDEEIYAVGHSLGGAVAQYIAYTFPLVTAVVFNPSPRTGYGAIPPEKFRNPPVCRIRESYEAVYTLAGGKVPIVEPNMHSCGFINQHRLRFPLLPSLVSAHSMYSMAESLACYAENSTPSERCEQILSEKHRAMPGVLCH
ncbi:DUF2974 domain-containing protein [Luteimonas sp. SJ-92]|uniref:DUF2974 domain-containing protein n=1 Tax=Luteimonas salinisoli TaxID=2752307 RepID=A0A853JD81_9GAMM|nr:DUF2974 domain-containing protein [Luteimonas salinisoli]